jgi:hypothetical protein
MLHVSAPQSHQQDSTEKQIHISFFVQLGSQSDMDLFFGRVLMMAPWS